VDIERTPPKKRRKYIIIGAAVAALGGLTVAVRQLEPASPSVERATLWIDSVKKGTMVREVRAPGTLVPEHIRIIAAVTAGRVEQLPIRPGAPVTPNTVIMELSNPDVQLQALEAERQLSASEAQLITLRTSLQTQRLTQEGAVAQMRSEWGDARRNAQTIDALDKRGLSSPQEVEKAHEKATELEARLKIEQARLKMLTESIDRQLALQSQQNDRTRAVAQFNQGRVQSMNVVAGEPGVLQEMSLELGQWVNPGAVLARVAQPGRLKAVLRVPETQVKDVTIGQPASIDTRNGIIPGRVIRIEPASQNGTVGVEVALEGELPKGARPDLSVDGTIQIEKLENVLYVGRPAYGQAESIVGLFRLDPDGQTATRVQAKLGRSSVNTIEVIQGLNVGDKVIISDMTAMDNVNKVRLK
jgi:multidrug resistance efflux pump